MKRVALLLLVSCATGTGEKGGLVALLLDLKIRASTRGERSLDDVLRLLWERFGATDTGFPEGEVERVAAEVCGCDLAAFFDHALRSTEELEYDDGWAKAQEQSFREVASRYVV